MTLNDIRLRLESIVFHRDDPVIATSNEHALYRDTLQAIADGSPTPRLLAAAALKAREIQFSRYYA